MADLTNQQLFDSLTGVVQDIVRQEVGKLNTRFDGLEGRFDKLETRFDYMETRFDTLERMIGELTRQNMLLCEELA